MGRRVRSQTTRRPDCFVGGLATFFARPSSQVAPSCVSRYAKQRPATNPKQTKETCLSWSPWRMEQKPAEEWIYAGTPVVVCRFLNWDARLRIGPHQFYR